MARKLDDLPQAWHVLASNRPALAGFVVLLLFLGMAVVGPALVPLDMVPDYARRFQAPSLAHILGTDYAGRDTASLIVHGSRDIMLIAFSAGFFATVIALCVGIPAGLAGGRLDAATMLVIDIFLTVPAFPIMAIMAALFRIRDPLSFGLVLAAWSWPGLARSIRTQILALRNREFIEAARVMAMPASWIVFGEILPTMVPYISVNFIAIAKGAITASVGIMLLGLVPLQAQNWGMMLNLAAFQSGAIFVPHAYAYVLAPIAAIVLFQYSLVYFAGGLEEIFDPRLRRR